MAWSWSCRHSRALMPLVALMLAGGVTGSAAQNFVSVTAPDIQAHVAFSTGAAWIDVDGDGDLDLFVTTAFGTDNNNVLYRNDGGGVFRRVSATPIGQDGAQTVCSTWADVDNDNAIDVFVSGLDTDHGLLYRGRPTGPPNGPVGTTVGGDDVRGVGCAWGDYDNDGYVDLVLSVLSDQLGMSGPNRLFRNLGNGTFAEVTGVPPTTQTGAGHHPTWIDFDGDGDLDLCFASGPVGHKGFDVFYRNQLTETGTASFVSDFSSPLMTETRDSQTLSWADYDNDGDLDCYAINYTSVPNQLYRNEGNGVFTNVIDAGSIVTNTGRNHGVAWGDFDNDGDLDVYVVTDLSQPNRYYRNEGNGTFTSVTTGSFVTLSLSNYGVAAGDYDGDGDLDLFVPTARSEAPSVLYRNDLATGAHWLEVTCVGWPANRSAIGARVRVLATIGGVPRWQMREISASSGYGSESALAAHFGLGDAVMVDSIVVRWPGGAIDWMTGVPVNTAIRFPQGFNLVGVSDHSGAPGRLGLRIVPQPLVSRGEVGLALAEPARVRVAVYDLQGREVAGLRDGWCEAGITRVPLDGARLPSAGIYLVRATTGRDSVVRRLVYVP